MAEIPKLEETDPLKVLILDAGAFITQAKFDHFGPEVKYVTVAAVVQHELKDENARRVHDNFPFPIETRIPSGEAIKAIIDFAKKTGDYPSLGPVDIQVLALSYMYEKERNGMKRIRQEPPKRIIPPSEKKSITAPSSAETLPSDAATASTETSTTTSAAAVTTSNPASATTTSATSTATSTLPSSTAPVTFHTGDASRVEPQGVEDAEEEEVGAEEGDEGDDEQEEEDAANGSTATQDASSTTTSTAGAPEIPANDPFWGSSEDPEGEWITASNIHLQKHKVRQSVPLSELSDVGCITTDFAMQNVMIAMGLRLLSVRGLSITTIRTHVRRCHACWAVEHDMEKATNFCRNCGGHTLMKAVFHMNENGVPRYYMSQKQINNKRGTVYSIPKFRGGRHNKDLILREDAFKSTKLHAHKKKTEDAFADAVEFGYGTAGGKVSTQHASEQFGYGKRNPNVVQVGKRDKNKRNHRRK